jgi:hypothetical protein
MNAMKSLTKTIGVICGISGLEHGFFEALQGNVAPEYHTISGSPMIYAIGDAQRFWKYGFEYAFTVVPDYLITGILAMAISLLVVFCSVRFLDKKFGWLGFIVLSVLQYLTGGGAAQFGPAIMMGLVAITIRHPLKWRRATCPGLRRALAWPWLWLLILFAFVFCHSIVTAVFGFFYGVNDPEIINQILWGMLDVMIILLPLAMISALVRDSLVV